MTLKDMLNDKNINISSKDIKCLFSAKSAFISLLLLALLAIVQNRHHLWYALLYILLLAPPLIHFFKHYTLCKKDENCRGEKDSEIKINRE